MINVLKSESRGYADHGWLKSFHTFSFADFYNPKQMGFRALRVINEDFIARGAGFPTHPHHNMEIVTYVMKGALAHRDSMGNSTVIHAGEVQRMTAGTGITHSEYNHSQNEDVELFQIWILPERQALTPGYEQKQFSEADKENKWALFASPDGENGSVKIHQEVRIYSGLFDEQKLVPPATRRLKNFWLQVVSGEIVVAEKGAALPPLTKGDALIVEGQDLPNLEVSSRSHLLLFELA